MHAGKDAIIPQWLLGLLEYKFRNPLLLLTGCGKPLTGDIESQLLLFKHHAESLSMMKVTAHSGTDETTAASVFLFL